MPVVLHPPGMGMIDKDLLNRNLASLNIAGMTTTQRQAALATSPEGTLVYDTTMGKLCLRAASAWQIITSA